jgi:hypothetical protein
VYLRSEADSIAGIVRSRLKGRLANTLYGTGVGRPILNQTDPTFQKAMSLWPNSTELAGYHAPSAPVPNK